MAQLNFAPPPPFTETTETLRAEVRAFLDKELVGMTPAERARSWSGRDAAFSKKMADKGWIGMTWPKKYGGHERSALERFVVLEEMLLKPNMVVAGKLCKKQASVDEVCDMTLQCFRQTVPAAVPGIVFLSGGQSSSLATAHLNAMCAKGPHPWQLSFSYGRALQDEALKAWRGQEKSVAAGQKAFYSRAKLNGAAREGKYSEKLEKELTAV